MSKKSVLTNPNSNMRNTKKADNWLLTNAEKQEITYKKYINSLINHKPLNICPECHGEIVYTEDEDEYYCSVCGLVTQSSIEYVAGFRIFLPYGRR